MATDIKEKALDVFLSKLDPEKAQAVRAAFTNREIDTEKFLAEHVGQNLDGVDLEGRSTDAFLDSVRKEREEMFPDAPTREASPQGPPVEGFSWEKFLNRDRDEHHGGGGLPPEKDPQMHTFIKDEQKKELFAKLEEIAKMTDPQKKEEREQLLNQLLERFDSRALLDDYNTKFMSYLEKLPSFQEMDDDQKKTLKGKLSDQSKRLLESHDKLEQEAGEVRTMREAREVVRKAELKTEIEKLLAKGLDKKTQNDFDHLVEQHQGQPRVEKFVRQNYAQGNDSIWQIAEFNKILGDLYNFYNFRQFIFTPLPTTPMPRPMQVNIPQPSVAPEPIEQDSPTGSGRNKNKKKKKKNSRITNFVKGKIKNFAKKPLENLAKEGVKKGVWWLFTTPPAAFFAWGFVVIIIVFLLAFLLLFSLGNSAGQEEQQQQQQQQLHPAVCIDAESIQAATDPSSLSQTFQNKYHITLSAKDSATLTLSLVQNIYTDSCIAFGQIKDGGMGANNFDTLGKYVTGYTVGALSLQLNLATDSSQTDCSAIYVGQNSKTITWQLTNFDLCNDGRQRFLLGKTLANIFTQQQNYLRAKSRQSRQTLLDQFRQAVTAIPRLPTKDCYSGGGDTQTLGCFTDMSGEYLSFPYYFYQSPNYTPPANEQNFMNYPTDYSTYYYFAQHNLFGDLDFFHVGHPKPPYTPTDYAAAIKKEFNITMIGMPQQELQWAWEKFWDVSNTNYMKDLKNARAIVYNSPGTAYMFCNSAQGCIIHLHEFGDQMGFDVVLLHELAHVIDYSNPLDITHKIELMAAVIADRPTFDGWVTKYSQLLCLYPPNMPLSAHLGEDYAEMLTYYVNPQANMLTACGWGDNPYANGLHAAHKSLAQKILGVY